MSKEELDKVSDNEILLKAYMDSTSDSIIIVNSEHKIISLNKFAQENLERLTKKKVSINDLFIHYLHPDQVERFYEDYTNAVNGISEMVEKPISFGKDLNFWVQVTYFPVYDNNKNLRGVAINTKNVTEQRVQERKIKKSEQLLRAVYNSATDSVLLISLNKEVLFFNKQAENLSKSFYDKTLTIGSNVLEYVLDEQKKVFEKFFYKALFGQKIDINFKVFNTKSNSEIFLNILYYPVYDEENKCIGICINLKDITEIKNAEKLIKSKNKSLEEIAFINSHEIRKPIANMIGLIDLFETSDEKNQQEIYFNYIKDSLKELDDLVHAITKKTE